MASKRYPQILHTWMYGNMEFERIARSLREIGADGADLGITFTGERNNPDVLAKTDVMGILARENLKVFCVTPLCNRPELDLSNPDPSIKKTASEFVMRGLELAEQVGCDRMLITPSWFSVKHTLHDSYEEDFKRGTDAVANVAEAAARRGLRVLIEPINRFRVGLVHTIGEVMRMIDAIGMPNLGIAADTYHMNMEEGQSVASTVLQTGGRLGCLHIGENNRKPPGFGSLDWKSIILSLRAIGFDGPLSHEPVYMYFDENKVASDESYYRRFQEMMAHGLRLLNMVMETL